MCASRLPSFRMHPLTRTASGPAAWVAEPGPKLFSFDEGVWRTFKAVGQNDEECFVLRGTLPAAALVTRQLSTLRIHSGQNADRFSLGVLSVPAGTYDLRVIISFMTGKVMAFGLRRESL